MTLQNYPSLIIGIGASTVDVSSLIALIEKLPSDSDAVLVFIFNQRTDQQDRLYELLKSHRPDLKIQEVAGETPLVKGRVYLKPPSHNLVINNGRLKPVAVSDHCTELFIDIFFISLAREFNDQSIGVLLCGAGDDGIRGAQYIRAAGGTVIVQNPASTKFSGAVQSIISAGLADKVLEIEQIVPETLKIRNAYPSVNPTIDGLSEQAHFKTFFYMLHQKTGFWFNHYKHSVLTRRLQRRLSMHGIVKMEDYYSLLEKKPDEAFALVQDFMIGVSSFFRNPDLWEILKANVIVPLLAQSTKRPVRVWTPACSTGEEAYSIAMLLHAEMNEKQRGREIQIFATDINDQALERAREGKYPRCVAENIPEQYLKNFITSTEDPFSFVINKQIREHVVFARQNLLTDPPFSKLDLIICRNLLIYLQSQAQEKCLDLFHYALNAGGVVFLGNAETVGNRTLHFKSVASKHARIYRKDGSIKSARLPISCGFQPEAAFKDNSGTKTVFFKNSASQRAQEFLLESYAPAAVGIDSQFEIFYRNGPTHHFLAHPRGPQTNNLLDHLPQNIRPRIRSAVYKAQQTNSAVQLQIAINWDGKKKSIDVSACRFDSINDLMLVTFREIIKKNGNIDPEESSKLEETALRQMEYELSVTRDDNLRNLEQLKSLNEELQSANEELQAANEELETSREELQSLNEELLTVNSQLQQKVEELETINNDLTNFLSSTNIPTIFLDEKFHIRRFTPAITRLAKLITADIGRPLSDLSLEYLGADLDTDVSAVLQNLTPCQKEIYINSACYIRTVQPYRTSDNRILGSVVTYVDITEQKQAEQALAKSEARHRQLIGSANSIIIRWDINGRIRFVNDYGVRFLGCTVSELMDRDVMSIIPEIGRNTGYNFNALVNDIKLHPEQYTKVLSENTNTDGDTVWIIWTNKAITDENGEISEILAIGNDISELKRLEMEREELIWQLYQEQDLLQKVMDTPSNFHLAYLDNEFNFIQVNRIYSQGCGYQPGELIGRNHFKLFPNAENEQIFSQVRDTGAAMVLHDKPFFYQNQPERGLTYWDWTLTPVKDKSGAVEGLVLALNETTQKKKAAEALRISEKRFRGIFEHAATGIAIIGLDGAYQQVNPAFCAMSGFTEAELLNTSFPSLIYPDDLEANLQKVELLKKKEISSFEIENRYVHKNGHVIWVRKYISVLLDAEGNPAHILGLLTDMTERKQSEEAIKQSRDHFALLASTANELLQSSEPQRIVESLCHRVMKLLDCHIFFNFLVDESSGKLKLNVCSGISEKERGKMQLLDFGVAACGCAASDGCSIIAENVSSTIDLRTELVKSYGIKAYACHPLLAENGRVIGILSFGSRSHECFGDDDLSLIKAITDQVAVAMERIQHQRNTELIAARDEAILKSLTEGLVVVNKNGCFMEMNPAALELHGFEQKEQMWTHLNNYVQSFELLDLKGKLIPLESWPVSKVMRGEKLKDYIVQFHRKNTENTLIISYNGVRVYDNNGIYINMVFTMRDVTVQKALEVQLQRERELLQTIFNSIPVMLTIYDPADLTFITNSYMEQVTGWAAEEMKKSDAMVKVFPDPLYRKEVTKFLKSLETGFKDLIMTGKNGEKIESSWANIGLEDGRHVGIGIDIRERKRAEEKLQLAYGRLQTFFDHRIGGIGIVIASADGKISMANDCFLHLLGYNRKEMQSGLVNWKKITPHEWRNVDKLALTQITERGVSDTFEKEYQKRDNTRVPVLITCAVMPGDSGDILVFILDITDRKKAETALRKSEERFRKMFESHGAVMLLVEPQNGSIIDANIAAASFYGYTRELLRTMKIQQISQLPSEMLSDDWKEAVKRKCCMFVLQHRLSGGQVRTVEVYSSPIVIGNRTLLFSIIHDITERRKMEDQLHKNAEELAAANRELEAFSYSVSHDLRAPLRTIKGFSDFLLEDYHDRFDKEGQMYLNRIVSGVARMDSLIDDLLSLSLISRQQMNIQKIDISRMAEEIMEELCQRAEPRHLEIVIEKNLWTRGDTRLINLALTNLLENAWKYTGKRDRAVIEFGEKKSGEKIVYFVKDNGAGFSMAQVERLFKPFQRLHAESEFSGTGVGLAIVERVVNRHGGKIWAKGELGVGAEFCFTLGSQEQGK